MQFISMLVVLVFLRVMVIKCALNGHIFVFSEGPLPVGWADKITHARLKHAYGVYIFQGNVKLSPSLNMGNVSSHFKI
jgi:hypothetical protein